MLPVEQVIIEAGSRLHFGMFALGHDASRAFGGVGAMIDLPALRLRARLVNGWTSSGLLAERSLVTAKLIERHCRLAGYSKLSGADIEVHTAPPEHIGLGVGTQLSLAIATALLRLRGIDSVDATELAQLAGRGARSAVGTHGFLRGGLVVESGKTTNALAPLAEQITIPAAWRFVLVVPLTRRGLSGETERQAFAELSPVPAETSARLRRMALDELVPAAQAADFATFSESLYRFNHEAGLLFSAWQHGAYADRPTADLAALLRSWGVAGVGQSSWGPTLFALQIDEPAAASLMDRIKRELPPATYAVLLAQPFNRGAVVVTS